jgi:hypothetical protein
MHINRFARGHPLALELAAAAVLERPGLDLEVGGRVVEELTRLYLADVPDPLTRRVLEAAAVVRRTTRPLLQAMLPAVAPQDAYDRLRALPFVESTRDGLHVHDVVQQAIAATLRAADPGRYRDHRRAAWRHLQGELRQAGPAELWRATADILYLLENPVLREAFFPTGTPLYAIEPALPEDGPAIHAIVAQHEGPAFTALIDGWWRRAPSVFQVARDRDGAVAGFSIWFSPDEVADKALLRTDPIVGRFMAHLRRQPLAHGECARICVRWLSREQGEAPSLVQAALWLDFKRCYLELRTRLRRVYMIVRDLPTYGPIAQQLKFQLLGEANMVLDGVLYHAALLDMGPGRVDGWLASHIEHELGLAPSGATDLLDVEAREVVIDGQRVGLTRLEFGVLRHLTAHAGRAVSRQELLADVWGSDYLGGSNVVDAVVRTLRRKLGSQAHRIAAVRGVGYRFRRE